jgi:hypothetical protein
VSQTIVLQLLKKLGKAKTKQVAALASELYPDSSLHNYVGDRLNKLKKWGYVDKDENGLWFVLHQVGKKAP